MVVNGGRGLLASCSGVVAACYSYCSCCAGLVTRHGSVVIFVKLQKSSEACVCCRQPDINACTLMLMSEWCVFVFSIAGGIVTAKNNSMFAAWWINREIGWVWNWSLSPPKPQKHVRYFVGDFQNKGVDSCQCVFLEHT